MKDLITSKFSLISQDKIERKEDSKISKRVAKPNSKFEVKTKTIATVKAKRIVQPSNFSSAIKHIEIEEWKTPKLDKNSTNSLTKNFKKFVRKGKWLFLTMLDGTKKSFVKPKLSTTQRRSTNPIQPFASKIEEEEVNLDHFDEDISEGKLEIFNIILAIFDADPVELLIDFSNLDKIGKIIKTILTKPVEEKFDALVLFNEIIMTNLNKYTESLIK